MCAPSLVTDSRSIQPSARPNWEGASSQSCRYEPQEQQHHYSRLRAPHSG